jgi:hypothetical protein
MRAAVVAAIGVALGACSTFTGTETVADAGGTDASVDGADASEQADVVTDGGPDGANAAPRPSFCSSNTRTQTLFCSDFGGSAFSDGWATAEKNSGPLVTGRDFGPNRALGVAGTATDGVFDRLRSSDLPVAKPATLTLELKIHLTNPSHDIEIATLEGPTPADNIILFLSGTQLRIRVGAATSTQSVPLDVGVWSAVRLTVGLGTSLVGPKGSAKGAGGISPFHDSNAQLSVGAYHKEDSGAVDFALDDVLLTAP